jgi:hypothetical protein
MSLADSNVCTPSTRRSAPCRAGAQPAPPPRISRPRHRVVQRTFRPAQDLYPVDIAHAALLLTPWAHTWKQHLRHKHQLVQLTAHVPVRLAASGSRSLAVAFQVRKPARRGRVGLGGDWARLSITLLTASLISRYLMDGWSLPARQGSTSSVPLLLKGQGMMQMWTASCTCEWDSCQPHGAHGARSYPACLTSYLLPCSWRL